MWDVFPMHWRLLVPVTNGKVPVLINPNVIKISVTFSKISNISYLVCLDSNLF